MKTLAFILLALACPAIAQPTVNVYDPTVYKGQPVNLTPVPSQATTRLSFADGSGNEQYRCTSLSVQPTYTWAVTPTTGQGTLTSIVVSTNVGTANITAHGLQIGNSVVVSGSTTAALNATYTIATVPNANSFTFTTAGVTDATYNTSALKLATTAPRSGAAIWSIELWTYSSGFNTLHQWAGCSLGATATLNMWCACDSRATLSYQ